MRRLIFFAFLTCIVHALRPCFGDSLTLASGRTVDCAVLQTNGDNILVLIGNSTFHFSRSNIKAVKVEPRQALQLRANGPFLDSQKLVLSLSKQPWASNLEQIPATVIDKGILRNVPYISFRCSDDYEINIYGELESPAAIEVGVYRKLLDSHEAKSNCLAFVRTMLVRPADQEMLQSLDPQKDLKKRGELTFEVTPPTDEDAYNGWWVSVYDQEKLGKNRVSDAELQQITQSKAPPKKQNVEPQDSEAWSARELALARPANTNAQASTATAQQPPANARLQPLPAQTADSQTAYARSYSAPSYSSSGDRVYVRSYYRKDGTFVQSHTRSYPRR